MLELNDFYNAGFGWICRQCELDLVLAEVPTAAETSDKLSRAFREGEAESKSPNLSTRALAKWTDATQRYLTCPRCGITELVELS